MHKTGNIFFPSLNFSIGVMYLPKKKAVIVVILGPAAAQKTDQELADEIFQKLDRMLPPTPIPHMARVESVKVEDKTCDAQT